MRLLRWLIVLVVLGAAGASAWVWHWLDQPMSLASNTVELSIEPGTTPREVANAWVRAGVQVHPRVLYEWFRWSGDARRMRAGSYVVGPEVSPRQLLAKMVQGDEAFERVRLLEGWTLKQFRAELARAPHLKPASAGMSDAQLMTAIGADGVAGEGRFFPDTYLYSRGVSDITVLKRAYAAMQRHLNAAWEARVSELPLRTPNDALILASIVEKETGKASDRAQIAGVFTNRLKVGMPLQTDGPFNTYLRPGLPPTPIAMPGLASLKAAVNPERTKALYFVSRGDGSSVFSESLLDHNRAVNQYQRGGGR